MNERIRLLAEQAGFETDRGPLIGPSPYIKVGGLCVGVPLEKFAELIVRECANAIQEEKDTGLYNDQIMAGMTASKAVIKNLFGVEE